MYRKKLSALLVDTCPYKMPAGSWVDDQTKWPEIERPDVLYYLVVTESRRAFYREIKAKPAKP